MIDIPKRLRVTLAEAAVCFAVGAVLFSEALKRVNTQSVSKITILSFCCSTPILLQIKSPTSKIGYLNLLVAVIGTVILAVHFNGHIST